MAKLSFNKFGLKINQDVKNIQYSDTITIEIKQYLPVNDKLKMMGEILERTMDQNNFANPIKQEVFTILAIIEYYTNITFTEKQKEAISSKLAAMTGKTIILKNTIDPDVLGGLKLRYMGIQLDGTLRARLDAIESGIKKTIL